MFRTVSPTWTVHKSKSRLNYPNIEASPCSYQSSDHILKYRNELDRHHGLNTFNRTLDSDTRTQKHCGSGLSSSTTGLTKQLIKGQRPPHHFQVHDPKIWNRLNVVHHRRASVANPLKHSPAYVGSVNQASLRKRDSTKECQTSPRKPCLYPRDTLNRISYQPVVSHINQKNMSTLNPEYKPSGAYESSESTSDRKPATSPESVLRMMDRELASMGFDFCAPYVCFTPEKSIFRKWKILSELGSGTFATVLKLQNTDTGEIAAGKLLEPYRFEEYTQERIIQMFAREIKYSIDCQCPGILKVNKVLRGIEGWVLIQDLIDGGTLWDNSACNSYTDCFALLLQLIQAVIHMQSKKIVHRDLKPTNILRSSDRQKLYVTDFGWSESYSKLDCYIHELPGTIEINPPEVLHHQPGQSEKIDNYAVALNMLLLIGHTFVCRDLTLPTKKAARNLLEEIQTIQKQGPIGGFTPECWEVFLGLTEFDPVKRFTMSEVIHSKWFLLALNTYLGDKFRMHPNSNRVAWRSEYLKSKFIWHKSVTNLAYALFACHSPNVQSQLSQYSETDKSSEKFFEESDNESDCLTQSMIETSNKSIGVTVSMAGENAYNPKGPFADILNGPSSRNSKVQEIEQQTQRSHMNDKNFKAKDNNIYPTGQPDILRTYEALRGQTGEEYMLTSNSIDSRQALHNRTNSTFSFDSKPVIDEYKKYYRYSPNVAFDRYFVQKRNLVTAKKQVDSSYDELYTPEIILNKPVSAKSIEQQSPSSQLYQRSCSISRSQKTSHGRKESATISTTDSFESASNSLRREGLTTPSIESPKSIAHKVIVNPDAFVKNMADERKSRSQSFFFDPILRSPKNIGVPPRDDSFFDFAIV